jgi:hypothetical protein
VGFVPEKKKKKRRERAGEKALRGDRGNMKIPIRSE